MSNEIHIIFYKIIHEKKYDEFYDILEAVKF